MHLPLSSKQLDQQYDWDQGSKDTNDQVITLDNSINSLRSITLQNVKIPLFFKTITTGVNDKIYSKAWNDNTIYEAVLDEGDYTPTTLCVEIENKMEAVDPGTVVYTWAYDSTKNRITTSFTASTILYLNRSPALCEIIGIPPKVYDFNTPTLRTAPLPPDMNCGRDEVWIAVKEFDTENTFNTKHDNILFVLQIPTEEVEKKKDFYYEPIYQDIITFNKTFNMKKIHITFYQNVWGVLTPFYFYNRPWSIHFKYWTIGSKKRKALLDSKF